MRKQSFGSIISLIVLPFTVGLSATPTQQLRKQGFEYFQEVPDQADPRCVAIFSDSLRFMYAYQIRCMREQTPIDDDANRVLEWIYRSAKKLGGSKSDAIDTYSDEELLRTGTGSYDEVRASFAQDKHIWALQSYLSAVSNLYAYTECASKPQARAKKSLDWLIANRDSLVVGGGKSDHMGEDFCLTKKPRLDNHVELTHMNPRGSVVLSREAVTRQDSGEHVTPVEPMIKGVPLSASDALAKHRLRCPAPVTLAPDVQSSPAKRAAP